MRPSYQLKDESDIDNAMTSRWLYKPLFHVGRTCDPARCIFFRDVRHNVLGKYISGLKGLRTNESSGQKIKKRARRLAKILRSISLNYDFFSNGHLHCSDSKRGENWEERKNTSNLSFSLSFFFFLGRTIYESEPDYFRPHPPSIIPVSATNRFFYQDEVRKWFYNSSLHQN